MENGFCPKCNKHYNDTEHNYCYMCGTELEGKKRDIKKLNLTDKWQDYPMQALTHCPNCGKKELTYLSRVKTKNKENTGALVIMIFALIFIAIGIIIGISTFGNFKNYPDILDYAEFYKELQIGYMFTALGFLGLIITITIQVLKSKQIDTIVMAICPTCGRILQYNFFD